VAPTLNRQWLEVVANLLLARLAMTIFDPDRSRTVSIDFIDNPYHGEHHAEKGELCSMAPKDGTTTCHRYCTAYVVSNGKPVTLAMTYVRSDEDEADAVERVLARVENYPFEIDLLLADSGFYNERVIRRARDIPNGRSRAQEGRAHEGQTRNSQVVHDDLSHVQGQRAGTALPARGRCLLPERRSRQARRGRSWLRGVWRY